MIKTVKPVYPIQEDAPLGSAALDLTKCPDGQVPEATDVAPTSIQTPLRSGLYREALCLLELPRLMFRFPALARQPRGRGQPVLVLPGYGCGNVSTVVLQSYLRFLGYQVRGCGRGIYTGEVSDLLRRVLRRLMSMAHRAQEEVCIIGWSLGGYLAREAARERPDLVHQVITLGTPVIGGPKYTVVADVFRRRGIDVEALALQVDARNKISFPTPVTAIYSRVDAVVAWEACIDRAGLNVEHVEVATTHLGLGFSPEVYKIIAQKLANSIRSSHKLSNEGLQASRPKLRRFSRL
jgi:pimeloyl-ACP methyl ester carboxylesterase